ncbi:MAG: hypothetical protein AABX38_00080 [Candidatus Micrarchaeota archaeon]
MNKLFVTLFIIFTLTIVNYAANCEPGFVDQLQIRALDSKLRGIENAVINVTYQVDSTTGKGYFTSPALTTNENGTVSILIRNREQLVSLVDCNIKINALYAGTTVSTTVTANAHPSPIDLKFNAYTLTVQVVDQTNQPIINASIIINNITKKTDINGVVFLPVLSGSTIILVSSGDGTTERTVNVQDDLLTSIGLGFYPLNVFVVDDNNNPIPNAKVLLANKQYLTDSSGSLKLEKIFGGTQTITIRSGSITKTYDVDLSVASNLKSIFDITPPSIDNLNVNQSDQGIKITFNVFDSGQNPSGVVGSNVRLSYYIDSGVEQKASLYVRGKTQYTAEIKKPSIGSVLNFVIVAVDQDQNAQTVSGIVTVSGGQILNNTNGTTNPDQKKQDGQPGGQPFSLPLDILAGIVIVIIVVYLVYRFRGEES